MALAGLVLPGAIASIPGPGGVINACYLNASGTLRVVDSSNPTCLPTVETGISWQQSAGTAIDISCIGCVGSTDIQDGGVTSIDIADGSIAASDLGFDPATQAELDAHKTSADHDGRYFTETELQAPGVINSATNPVDWTKLKGVPAGFSDGVDDSGGIASDVVCVGCVETTDIANATITFADIAQNGCTTNQVMKWNGAAWACAADADTNSGGTVTSVGTGSGLTGGPITSSGSIAVATGGITAAHVADGTLTGADIADGAIGAADIADGSITSAKIANATITFADIAQNGCTTNQVMKWNGAAWACAADASLSQYERIVGTTFSIAASGGWNSATLSCPVGKSVVSGGVTTSTTDTLVTDSYPASTTAWFVGVRNNSGVSASATPAIICAVAT